MKRCIVMRGLPGSGKNHLISIILANLGFCGYHQFNYPGFWVRLEGKKASVISADDYFTDTEGVYRFDPTKIGDAHKDCLKRFLWAVGMDDEIVIVNNTNIHAWEMSPYIQVANAFDYEVVIFQVTAKIEDCIQRNLHGVPAHVIGGMREAMFREQLPDFWKIVKV